ncbi:OB-fold-containig protein [Clostridium sp. YIM B02506]|uniref:OB-fold-containig protein n=1 Tax=Clostridium sp. YIM B02506 TaxID=2910680 RepID=UPI001EEF3207|nr:OB-fold-containig protein [Clostridium sp. YIM B02506]
MSELINNAVKGVNIIPTVLLGLVLLYWITVIIGVFDFDLFELDFDVDVDADVFQGILVFLNLRDIPFMVFFSILSFIFWILSMMLYRLPITPGGFINGLILIPIFIVSLLVTKIITKPLKKLFKKDYEDIAPNGGVVGQLVTLITNIEDGRLGQGEIKRDGASLLINVKAEKDDDIFIKNEIAYVYRKDEDKNIYYIIKIEE